MTVLHAAEWHLLEMIKLADQKLTDVSFLCVIDLSTYRPLCNTVSVWLFDTHTVYTECGRERCMQGQACVATWCQLESVTLPGISKQRLHNITRQQWIHYSPTSIIPQDAWAQVGVEIITTSRHKTILISVGDYKGCWSAARNWLLPGRWWDVWLLNSRFWLKTHKKIPITCQKPRPPTTM